MEHNVKNILENGEKLPFNWYKFENKFYNIHDDDIRYETDDLILDEKKGHYLAPMRTSHGINATLVFAKGVESVKYIYYKDIEFLYDKYYIVDNPDLGIKELHYLNNGDEDDTVVTSDNIYYMGQPCIFYILSYKTYYILLVKDGAVQSAPVACPNNEIQNKETFNVAENLQKTLLELKNQ